MAFAGVVEHQGLFACHGEKQEVGGFMHQLLEVFGPVGVRRLVEADGPPSGERGNAAKHHAARSTGLCYDDVGDGGAQLGVHLGRAQGKLGQGLVHMDLGLGQSVGRDGPQTQGVEGFGVPPAAQRGDFGGAEKRGCQGDHARCEPNGHGVRAGAGLGGVKVSRVVGRFGPSRHAGPQGRIHGTAQTLCP